jgi:hypothetical protein
VSRRDWVSKKCRIPAIQCQKRIDAAETSLENVGNWFFYLGAACTVHVPLFFSFLTHQYRPKLLGQALALDARRPTWSGDPSGASERSTPDALRARARPAIKRPRLGADDLCPWASEAF